MMEQDNYSTIFEPKEVTPMANNLVMPVLVVFLLFLYWMVY